MKLDAWMEQGHSLDENLRLIESLSQAVNEVHDRGEALGGLQPDRIEVEAGDRCDLSEAKGGTPSPDYAPPDGEGDSAADVYAVGKMAWEILAGRSGGDSPQHLAEVRPDISKELADAIMACLERSALTLRRVTDLDAVLGAIAQYLLDLLAQMRMVDDQLNQPSPLEALDLMLDQRLAAGPQQRLGGVIGQRAHAVSASRGEDHGFHIWFARAVTDS